MSRLFWGEILKCFWRPRKTNAIVSHMANEFEFVDTFSESLGKILFGLDALFIFGGGAVESSVGFLGWNVDMPNGVLDYALNY